MKEKEEKEKEEQKGEEEESTQQLCVKLPHCRNCVAGLPPWGMGPPTSS